MLKTAFHTTLLVACLFSPIIRAAEIPLRIVETSDIHTHLTDFDYYKDQADPKYGITRTATLIKKTRAEAVNSIFVDNGDLLQGSAIGDYMAAKGLRHKEKHPAYIALEYLGASAGSIGNHEFNYGLEFLDNAISGTSIPQLAANITDAHTGKPRFTPYIIQNMIMSDTSGKKHTVKVGFIGLVTPQIMGWDKKHLDGKVKVADIVQTARHYVPVLKQKGADVIIALNHSGTGAFDDHHHPYEQGQENTTAELSKVEGIDAIAFGHEHGEFPSKKYAGKPGVDLERGTINGVPAVMPGQFGSHIGVMDLVLDNSSGKWKVVRGTAHLRPIYDTATKKPLVENDEELVKLLKPYHDAARRFVGSEIGESAVDLYSYLALVQDDPTVQIVNMAQKDYLERAVRDMPELPKLPILSAAAPFKAGGRKNDPASFTEVPKGRLTVRNAADLYLYQNTLHAVKVNGLELRNWLECSAGMFNQIDPTKSEPQPLLNWDGFHTFNFDVIDGVNYQVDLTQPARYDHNCKLVNPQANRIKWLSYKGNPVQEKDEFLVATNSYRATSGDFPGTGSDHVVYAAPDTNRQIVTDYISAKGNIQPAADHNWTFAPIPSAHPVVAYFETSPSERAKNFIAQHGVRPYRFLRNDNIGFAIYGMDLSVPPQ
ncbi:MAG: bifunctional 2',3'-cyclic-nucleotide 2'-phosphodiesterase/3'-nucleotidase [Conchiformibius sp.]|nr:bifunctional 2',3'-cyclic-nucleotide 2'-phosphodiesterase/3'-nucleotidase [Conchiformibius sp.]